eukprot:5172884-Prymnesium_polylepis.1
MCLGTHRATIRREKRAPERGRGEGRVRVRRRIGMRSDLESLDLSRLRTTGYVVTRAPPRAAVRTSAGTGGARGFRDRASCASGEARRKSRFYWNLKNVTEMFYGIPVR